MTDQIGRWAFLGGIGLAVLGALATLPVATVSLLLVLTAVVVGVFNVSTKETTQALLWVVALGAVGGVSAYATLGSTFAQMPQIGAILSNIATFFVTTALVFIGIFGYRLLKH